MGLGVLVIVGVRVGLRVLVGVTAEVWVAVSVSFRGNGGSVGAIVFSSPLRVTVTAGFVSLGSWVTALLPPHAAASVLKKIKANIVRAFPSDERCIIPVPSPPILACGYLNRILFMPGRLIRD